MARELFAVTAVVGLSSKTMTILRMMVKYIGVIYIWVIGLNLNARFAAINVTIKLLVSYTEIVFCEFLYKHDKLCAVIDWFKGYGVDMLICLLVLTGLIFGIWWLIDTDRKLDEKYRYQIKVHHDKYSDMYRTNSYTMGDDYIEFYIKDDQEKHMIVMKGDIVTIVDHLNKEDK